MCARKIQLVKNLGEWSRRLALLMPLVLLAVWLGPVAPAVAQSDAKLLLLMDSSGSMKEKAGSDSKINIAKHALNTVVAKLPATAQTGMRVYGATVFSRKDKGACTDSQLVVPIGTGNREALRAAIAQYKPYGETPIAYSLIQAAKDLGTTGRRTVVLVSDGEETCHADPCDTAAKLAKQGIDLKFDVIGLRVSGEARSQLQCIADKGNGTYYDAENAAQIEDSLDKLATRAFRPFRLSGTPVRGSTEESTPTTVQPGQYVDQFPAGDDPLYYRVPRTMTGSTIHVGLTTEVSEETGVSILLSTAKESFCGQDVPIVINNEGSSNVLTGEADSWRPTTASDCNTADAILIKVSRPITGLEGHRFELLISEEPPLADSRSLPPAAESYAWQTMTAAARAGKPPVPGSSISDAVTLSPGTYRTSILTGEKQVYGVRLGWGQRLQVQVVVGARSGALAKALSSVDTLNVQILSPMRGEFINTNPTGTPTNSFGMTPANKIYRSYSGTPPVVYLNRSEVDSRGHAVLPGTYSVLINKSRLGDEAEFLVPYTLIIKVIGQAGDGAPRYQASTSSTSAATPASTPDPSPTATPPTTPSAGGQPSTAPGGGVTSPTGGSGVGVGLVIGVGAGALLLGGVISAGIVLALRRRRR